MYKGMSPFQLKGNSHILESLSVLVQNYGWRSKAGSGGCLYEGLTLANGKSAPTSRLSGSMEVQ